MDSFSDQKSSLFDLPIYVGGRTVGGNNEMPYHLI
jgi:hypothetical protein